tara:strand:- start:7534 stop:8316 length:783 start_codon:yes stop_codon:yes gene_type:complete
MEEDIRYQISDLLGQGMSIALIAKAINCHRATVYRKLKRCHDQQGYCPDSAKTNACKMRRNSAKYTIPDTRINSVRFLLKHDWSPEQILQVLSSMNQAVSPEWIYRFVARNKRQGGKLYRHLRQGHKRYRRGKKEKAPSIKNSTSIESRPAIVDTRERFGDWEIDTVLGKHGTDSIVTILGRKTRFYLIKKVASKSAEDVTKATIELLMPYKQQVRTITADNGREFDHHEVISKALDTAFYFAHPHSSWERGANENATAY